MRGARIAIVVGIILAVAGLITWALWGKLEWSEQDVWVGYSGEARVNDFLAAQRLLERMGQRTSSIRGLPVGRRAPGKNDVLILPRRQVAMSPGQASDLINWVKKGGLLIVEGLTPESREAGETQDPLFRAVGARLIWTREKQNLEANIGGNPATGTDTKDFDEKNRDLTVDLDGHTYKVRVGAWEELLDWSGQATRSAKNDSGIKMLQYDLGDGRVILCTSLACIANGSIAEEDHAGFLSALATDWASGNRVWIVYREEPPSLWTWLRDNAWMIMISFAILVCISLWQAAARFGPRVPDPVEGRRSLLEHLLACGRFQWAQRQGVSLLRSAREATLSRIHRVHPGWGHLDPHELCARLAEFSGLAEDRIARALHKDNLREPREFTEAIQTLDLIRKQL
jgi:hypothetical protein